MKIKLLLPVLLLLLTGCGKVESAEAFAIKYNEPDVSYVEEDEDDGEEEYDSGESSSDNDIVPEPKFHYAEDLAEDFNRNGEVEGIAVTYYEEEDYWYLHYIGEESTDESIDSLLTLVTYMQRFLPLYDSVLGTGYMFNGDSMYHTGDEIYLVYTAVNSNWFAACTMCSYIEYGHLTIDVVIYDGRYGLYV